MRVLTCNVRGDNPEHDKDDQWKFRKDCCCGVIRSAGADIVCTQELKAQQFADLRAELPEYGCFGTADKALNRDPLNTIFYRADLFEQVSAGVYWLSETPHVPGSSSWDSACERLANWVRLVERASGVEFRVVNTHLDHVSQAARENQARMINEDASAYPKHYPQVFAGDLNADVTNTAIDMFKRAGWRDTYEAIHGEADPGATFHKFLGPAVGSDEAKIDWIFTRGRVDVLGAEIVRDARDGRFPSDHYFVSADLELVP